MPGLKEELMVFVMAVISGAIVRLAYRCIACFRNIIRHNLVAIGIEDLIFWIGSAIYIFVQIYHTSDGVIRWYFILGVVLGAIFASVFFGWMKKLHKKIYTRSHKDFTKNP